MGFSLKNQEPMERVKPRDYIVVGMSDIIFCGHISPDKLGQIFCCLLLVVTERFDFQSAKLMSTITTVKPIGG